MTNITRRGFIGAGAAATAGLALAPTLRAAPQPPVGPAGIKWAWVPGGTFLMGSPEGVGWDDERPQHEVTVPGFWMSVTPVTVGQFMDYANAARFSPDNPRDWSFNAPDIMPMTRVSWHDAQSFCRWAGCRLPTEAEWEYAAKLGQSEPGWTYENSGSRLHAVAEREPDRLGLHDMLGNIWEWCEDRYAPSCQAVEIYKSVRRVLRGGSWLDLRDSASASFRFHLGSAYRSRYVGFRVVRVSPISGR